MGSNAKTTSRVKNFWVFRIAGALDLINSIKLRVNKKSNRSDVIEFMNLMHEAESVLDRANDLLRKIDHANIVK